MAYGLKKISVVDLRPSKRIFYHIHNQRPD